MTSSEQSNKTKSGRLLMIALFAAVIVAFTVSGGFVLAQAAAPSTADNATFSDRRARTACAGDADFGRRRVADDRASSQHSRLHRNSGLRKGSRIYEDDQRGQGRPRQSRGRYRDHRIARDGQAGGGCALFLWIQNVTDVRNQELVRQQVVPQQTADQTHSAMLQAKAALPTRTCDATVRGSARAS